MAISLQNKKKVYALGETVLDLITDNGSFFRAVPGGSVLNASVSLGRCGAEIQLITEYGEDKAGELIDDFLKCNNVKTDFSIHNSNRNTGLALAFLDSDKKPTYTFYRDKTEKLSDFKIPEFTEHDILLFGSYYAVKPERSEFVLKIVQKAIKANSFIYYDLNIRKSHLAKLDQLMPSFFNNISAATVVKGSDEDFYHLFGITDPELIFERIKPFCKNLIITSGEKPIHLFINGLYKSLNVPSVLPVSTIGAGDNFNAGFIYALLAIQVDIDKLKRIKEHEIDRILGFSLAFATQTCLSEENYIPEKFIPELFNSII